ncbi:MAG: hypothetical protein ACOCT9_00800 [archaeon]
MSKKVILIGGTGRNGSTLLDLMIGNDPKGFSAGELYYLFRPNKPSVKLNKGDCFCNKKNCSFWSSIKDKCNEKVIYDCLFNELNIDFIVDSSKNPLWIRKQINYGSNKNYEIIPIIIYKTPLEYAYSRYKRDDLDIWKKSYLKVHKSIFYIMDDFVTIKYKDLAKNPSKKLKSICDSIGIDYFKGKEKFWNNDNTNHLIRGSPTLKKANDIVYYEDQYDQGKIDYLKKNITINSEVKKVFEVLNGFEIDSSKKEKRSAKKIKDEIMENNPQDILIRSLRLSPYYWINLPINLSFKLMEKFGFDYWRCI